MELNEFVLTIDDFNKKIELEKVAILAYYHFIKKDIKVFSLKDICFWFDELHLSTPNTSRLRINLTKSKDFIKAPNSDGFKLHSQAIQQFNQKFIHLLQDSNDIIVTSNEVLPKDLFSNTRGYIDNLAKQINKSYECNMFDACAVLMRRLLEILLILTYEHLNISNEIKKVNGEYEYLDKIIENAKSNTTLNLSRNSKQCVDIFRKLGNFAAHKIHYITQKNDIKNYILDFSAIVQELLYKTEIKK